MQPCVICCWNDDFTEEFYTRCHNVSTCALGKEVRSITVQPLKCPRDSVCDFTSNLIHAPTKVSGTDAKDEVLAFLDFACISRTCSSFALHTLFLLIIFSSFWSLHMPMRSSVRLRSRKPVERVTFACNGLSPSSLALRKILAMANAAGIVAGRKAAIVQRQRSRERWLCVLGETLEMISIRRKSPC